MLRGTDFSREASRCPGCGLAQATPGVGMVYWALGWAGQKKSPGRCGDSNVFRGPLSSSPLPHGVCYTAALPGRNPTSGEARWPAHSCPARKQQSQDVGRDLPPGEKTGDRTLVPSVARAPVGTRRRMCQ